jgi:hypothetical protein
MDARRVGLGSNSKGVRTELRTIWHGATGRPPPDPRRHPHPRRSPRRSSSPPPLQPPQAPCALAPPRAACLRPPQRAARRQRSGRRSCRRRPRPDCPPGSVRRRRPSSSAATAAIGAGCARGAIGPGQSTFACRRAHTRVSIGAAAARPPCACKQRSAAGTRAPPSGLAAAPCSCSRHSRVRGSRAGTRPARPSGLAPPSCRR